MFRFLFNLLWFVLGGLVMGLGGWLAGLLCAISVVGLPWARSCFVIGNFSFWPFGQEAISRQALTGRRDWGTGSLGTLGNVIWFLVAGWWLAIGHLTSALACFLTVVGIPFGLQHIKLAQIALAPVGMTVVPKRWAGFIPEGRLEQSCDSPDQFDGIGEQEHGVRVWSQSLATRAGLACRLQVFCSALRRRG